MQQTRFVHFQVDTAAKNDQAREVTFRDNKTCWNKKFAVLKTQYLLSLFCLVYI